MAGPGEDPRQRELEAAGEAKATGAAAEAAREPGEAARVLEERRFGPRALIEAMWTRMGLRAALEAAGADAATERAALALAWYWLHGATGNVPPAEWAGRAYLPELSDPAALAAGLEWLEAESAAVLETVRRMREGDLLGASPVHLLGWLPLPDGELPGLDGVLVLASGDGHLLRTSPVAEGAPPLDALLAAAAELRRARVDAVCVLLRDGDAAERALRTVDDAGEGIHRLTSAGNRDRSRLDALLRWPARWAAVPGLPGHALHDVELSEDEAPLGRAERWIAVRDEAEAERTLRRLQRMEVRRPVPFGEPVEPPRDESTSTNPSPAERARRRAGVRLLRTTLVELEPAAVVAAWQAWHRTAGDLRALLATRSPATRTREHLGTGTALLGATLARMIAQEVEWNVGRSYADLAALFQPVRARLVEEDGRRAWTRDAWSPEAARLLDHLGIDAGPERWEA